MPLIQVKLIEGVFDAAEKEAIIEKLTDAMVSVEGEAMRPVTWVTIEEVASGEWGIAGKALHTGDINLRPSGYEPDELPDCSTPRRSGTGHTPIVTPECRAA